MVNASTLQSSAVTTEAACSVVVNSRQISGAEGQQQADAPGPQNEPAHPLKAASIRLSVRSWRTQTAAAGADRGTDGDLPLPAAARASNKLATLAQAINSTKLPRPPESAKAAARRPPGHRAGGARPALSFLSIHCGLACAESFGRHFHVGLGGLNGDAGLEAAGGQIDMTLVGAVWVRLHGDENFGGRVGMEAGGKNAYDVCTDRRPG